MKFLINNNATRDITVITASSSNANFPVANLKHPFRSKRWRSTGVSSEWVKFDLSIFADAVDSFVMLWPKEDPIAITSGATIRIQANDTDVWTSPSVDEYVTINDTYKIASKYWTSAQTYRYWRVLISDVANPSGYLELGVVWFGKALGISNADKGFKYELEDKSKVTSTPFGNEYVDEYPLVASVDLGYTNLSSTDVEILEAAYRLKGRKDPILVVIDEAGEFSDKDHFVVYGKMKSSITITQVNFNIFNADMSVTELS